MLLCVRGEEFYAIFGACLRCYEQIGEWLAKTLPSDLHQLTVYLRQLGSRALAEDSGVPALGCRHDVFHDRALRKDVLEVLPRDHPFALQPIRCICPDLIGMMLILCMVCRLLLHLRLWVTVLHTDELRRNLACPAVLAYVRRFDLIRSQVMRVGLGLSLR